MDPVPDYLATISTGTCHVVVQTADAVVFASDSRSASSVVMSPATNKIWQVAPRIFVGRCGTASHTQYLANQGMRVLASLAVRGADNRAVQALSNFLGGSIQVNRDLLSASLVVGGWDEGGPQVFAIAQSGFVIRRKLAIAGSGGTYIAAWIDRNYREDFTTEEAVEFGVRAISHAIVRDGGCGGVVNLVIVTKDGAKRRVVKPDAQPVNEDGIKT
jgi:20S proteasome alpha/beta subunit